MSIFQINVKNIRVKYMCKKGVSRLQCNSITQEAIGDVIYETVVTLEL